MAVGELRVGADADIAGIVRMQMIEQHLAAEGAADRQRPGFGDRSRMRDFASALQRVPPRMTKGRLAAPSSSASFCSSASPGDVSTGV